jgi:Fe-S oxidoreductase
VLEDVGFEINKDLAERNVESILATGAKRVITGCPYCWRTFNAKPDYAVLEQRGVTVIHITQLLKEFDWEVKTEKRVTYHDSCDLGRHCGIYAEPRLTIGKIAPNFVEMPHNHDDALCCGAGGGVRGAYAKNSIAMARRRLKEVEETGAEVVLSDCNSCIHNLVNAKLRKQKFEIRTTAEFINMLMDEQLKDDSIS